MSLADRASLDEPAEPRLGALPVRCFVQAGGAPVLRAHPPAHLLAALTAKGPREEAFDEDWTWDAAWAAMTIAGSRPAQDTVDAVGQILAATRRSAHFRADPSRSVPDRFALLRLLFPVLVAIEIAGSEGASLRELDEEHGDWLAELVAVEAQPGGRSEDSLSHRNNHLLLRAAVAMQWGALTDDRALLDRGPAAFEATIGRLADDGSLPDEAARGASAAWYTNLALMLLVSIAHMGTARGRNLLQERFAGRSIDQAIAFYLEAIKEPSLLWPYSRANQFPHPRHGSDPFAIDLTFLETYHRSRHYLAWIPLCLAHAGTTRRADELRPLLERGSAWFPLVNEFAGGVVERFLVDRSPA